MLSERLKSILFLFFLLILQIASGQTYVKFQKNAEEAYNQEHYKQALDYSQDALKIVEKDSGKSSLIYAVVLNELGFYLFSNDEREKGEATLLSTCTTIKEKVGDHHPAYLAAWSKLGTIYFLKSEFHKALTIFQAIVDIQAGDKSNQTDYYANLNALALCQESLSLFPEAEKNVKTAQLVLIQTKQDKTIEYASTLNNLASIYQDQNLFSQAEKPYLSALALYAKLEGEKSADYAAALKNLATLYVDMMQYEKALSYDTRVLQLKKELYGVSHIEYAAALNDMAAISSSMGDLLKSELYYNQSLVIKKKVLGEKDPSYIRTLNSLMTLYTTLNKIDQALVLSKEIMAFVNAQQDDFVEDYFSYMRATVTVYQLAGKTVEAIQLIEKALSLYAKMYGTENLKYADLLESSAGLYYEKGEKQKAESLYLQGLGIYEKMNATKSDQYMMGTYYLGLIYLDQDKYVPAEKKLKLAMTLSKQYLGKNNYDYSTYLINLAYVYDKMERNEEAEKYYLEAMDNYKRIISQSFDFISTEEKAKYKSNLTLHASFFNQFVVKRMDQEPGLLSKMYAYRLLFKSMMLTSSLNFKNNLLNTSDEGIRKQVEEWIREKEYLNKLYTISSETLQSESIHLDSLEHAADLLDKKLIEESASFSEHQKKNTVSWKEVQQSLAEGEAAVEIIRLPLYGQNKDTVDVYYVALIFDTHTKDQPQAVVLKNGRLLDGAASDFYFMAVQQKLKDPNSYNLYWSAIADQLKGIHKLYLSTDGLYNYINVNTLQNPKTGAYVIDDLEVCFVKNTADIIHLKNGQSNQSTATNKTATLFGHPNYYFDLTRNQQLEDTVPGMKERSRKISKNFQIVPELPSTKTEVESISKTLIEAGWKVNLLMDDQADEKTLKQMKAPGLLHIATHGYYESGTEEGKKSKEVRVNREVAIRDPLSRCGLMLAGSGFVLKTTGVSLLDKVEDGILSGNEIANMNLTSTDLVVLSACLSRIGKMSINDAEGNYGLLSAFLLAGAKTVIGSSWPVDDKATEMLMRLFYQQYVKTNMKSSAFREAQLELKKTFPEPYYWGAFVMVGG